MKNPVQCDFSSATRFIERISIHICDKQDSGTSDKIKIEMENFEEEKCLTDSLDNLKTGHLVDFDSHAFDQEQNRCKHFKVTESVSMRVINMGEEDLCLQDVRINTMTDRGEGNIMLCQLNLDSTNQYNSLMYVEGRTSTDDFTPSIFLDCA